MQRTDSRQVGEPGSYADLVAAPDAAGSLRFTLYWPAEDRWLGRDWEVVIHPEPPKQMPTAMRPQS